MQNLLRLSGFAATVVAFAASAPSAVAQEKAMSWACQGVGGGTPMPVGDREGHSISVDQYSCRVESGAGTGGVGAGVGIWEWDGPKATLISNGGVASKPGATLAWRFAEGQQALTMSEGKVTGCSGSGKGTDQVATGEWASWAGATFTCTWKCVGPASQFTVACTHE